MRTLKLWPNEALKTPCLPVDPSSVKDAFVQTLITDLKHALIAYQAQGIAAPQVGENVGVIVILSNGVPLAMVNPTWEPVGTEVINSSEGCLSLPGVVVNVSRYHRVIAHYQDDAGNVQSLPLEGIEAVAVQHEVDHLKGVTMLEHAKPLARRQALKRLAKVKKRLNLG